MSENQFKFKGKVTNLLEVETITSKKGETFQKQTIVVEEQKDKYPQSGAFEFFGKSYETLAQSGVKEGDEVEIAFNVDSREWKGRFFPSLKGYGIDVISSSGNNQQPTAPPPAQQQQQGEEASDDLPF